MSIQINGTSGISGVDGTAGTPALQGSDTNTGISFGADTVNINTGGTTRATVDSSGRVGIGTTSPSALLHSVVASAGVTFRGSNNNTGIDLYANDATGEARLTASRLGGSGGKFLSFYTDTGSGEFERARIDSSGRLLVGTTTSYGRIHAAGYNFNPTSTTWLDASVTVSGGYGGGFAMLDGPAGYSIHLEGSGSHFYIQRHTSTTSSASGGVFINNGATSWSSASDERDKVDLHPITNGLEKIRSLRAVIGAYSWEPEIRHPFLIAQDVQEVLPEAISIQNPTAPVEDQRLGMSYTDMIPLLVQALKEAGERIQTLETRLTALEGGAAQ